MTAVLLLASAAMAAVAAAGILHPFGRRGRSPAIEPLADPLEDERDLLLMTLRELEGDHAEGALGDEEYRSLRHETERQAVAVLRALDARDGAGTQSLAALRAPASPNGHRPRNDPSRRSLGPMVVLAGLAVAAGVTVLLVTAVGPRDAAQPITGDGTAGSSTSSLTFFQERVRQHPEDVAARLDLAQRYRDAGLTGLAALQYTEALRLDPSNGEARTGMASVLFAQGHVAEALGEVKRALAVDPTYPEALYQEGLILLRGLHRPLDAATPLRAYLSAAPTGGHRVAVEGMLEEIAALPAATPSP
jgi:tetratricopeptide (TPR) repeat protein